jgi:hypothetical protein
VKAAFQATVELTAISLDCLRLAVVSGRSVGSHSVDPGSDSRFRRLFSISRRG